MNMYLRSKINGVIMDRLPRLEASPDWELITEQQAYPERFAPVDLEKREVLVELKVPEEAVAPAPTVPPELIAEVSRRPFKNVRIRSPGPKGAV